MPMLQYIGRPERDLEISDPLPMRGSHVGNEKGLRYREKYKVVNIHDL